MTSPTSAVDTWFNLNNVVYPADHECTLHCGMTNLRPLYYLAALFTRPSISLPMSHLESGPDLNHNASSLLFTYIPYPLARMSIHQWYTLVEKKYRNSQTWSMSLAFKSQLHLHTVHAMLMSQANVRGLAQFQVKDAFTPEMVAYIWLFEPQYVEQAIAWHRSQWDLQEMMKRAPLVTTTIRLPPMCQERPVSPVIECAWWKEHGSDPSMSFKY
ncbi:hypothetical protein BS47DRAFT_1396952 [Hydnum rufescens UP504]|uniref:Uncharacterized protein n=1 Tax=Hydnum rufescens UP504 TaxID=1448309 RepID=A0A9P6APN5_9AGAM|nr:hypothetical protein BS47DRAFT_1396952 [Hydnum rufescens UP504]